MTRRTVLMLTALLIAALGTGMIVLYVRGIENRATADQEMVSVLVAKDTIRTGETLAAAQADDRVGLVEVRRADFVAGALTDPGNSASQSALSTIYAGQQLLPQMFGKPASAKASGLALKPGQLAISVTLRDSQRVGGFVVPGSEVALYVSADVPGAKASDKAEPYTALLFPRVTVLGVGGSTQPKAKDGEADAAAGAQVVMTLAVDQNQAQKIIFAARNNDVSFALLAEKTDVKMTKGVKLRDVVPGAFGGAR